MLKKKYRLSASLSLKQARIIDSPLFRLRFLKNDLPFNRFGFVVSKKVDKRAVARNKVKRILQKSIQEIFEKINTGYDILFLAKPVLKESSFDLVRESIINIFKINNLLRQ
ncbi:MAG: ribonuclease P protein component [Patescibacteria group bacterium]|nr:ribonuclease P protein component [Patescibacteria group bacterium]